MTRIYKRLFDHDEARQLRNQGDSLSALAERFGVSQTAVWRVTTPGAAERMDATHTDWLRTTCATCGAPATKAHRKGEPRCRTCSGIASRTNIRDAELYCARCARWLPDAAFAKNRSEPARRGRHTACRRCLTELRREYRETVKVPCVKCGKPRLPKREIGPRGNDTGLCRDCYRARGNAA